MENITQNDKPKYPPRADRMKAIIADSSLANLGVLDALTILNKDLRNAAKLMSKDEIRYFVDSYYDIQGIRVATENRLDELAYPRHDQQPEKPSDFMVWFFKNLQTLEHQILTMMDKWSAAQPMGIWAREIVGIGPVFSSGLLANIDITRAPTAGHIWAFAGLDPTKKWGKGQKRPWNAGLKRLCWLIGESFVKVQSSPKDVYGKLYAERKAYETTKNVNKEYAALALERVENISKDLEASYLGKKVNLKELLSQGILPDKAIHERSKRWAVKMFLSDWHAEAFRQHFKREPPLPYPIAILGHAHLRGNWQQGYKDYVSNLAALSDGIKGEERG